MSNALQEILNQPLSEKMAALEAIWDSIDEDTVPVTDEELMIVKERYEEYLKNPSSSVSWEEAQKQLRAKHGL